MCLTCGMILYSSLNADPDSVKKASLNLIFKKFEFIDWSERGDCERYMVELEARGFTI